MCGPDESPFLAVTELPEPQHSANGGVSSTPHRTDKPDDHHREDIGEFRQYTATTPASGPRASSTTSTVQATGSAGDPRPAPTTRFRSSLDPQPASAGRRSPPHRGRRTLGAMLERARSTTSFIVEVLRYGLNGSPNSGGLFPGRRVGGGGPTSAAPASSPRRCNRRDP